MCGIFGYLDLEHKKTKDQIAEMMISGLKSVEYRGYDSAGLCILDGPEVSLYEKAVGKVQYLEQKIAQNGSLSRKEKGTFVSIAHTRWATHGKSVEYNAHPVRSDPDENFFVVHNGIITNYLAKKEILQKEGHTFETNTDTEVAAKLAYYYYKQNKSLSFSEVVQKVVDNCDGESSFIFISKRFPGEMVCAQNGLAMIIGVENPKADTFSGKECVLTVNQNSKFIISSDPSAIVPYTKTAVWGTPGTVFHLSNNGVQMFYGKKHDGKTVPALIEIKMSSQGGIKGDFPHFMLKEIFEQKESIVNATRNRVDYENGLIMLDSLKDHLDKFKSASRYMFVGCGTSYNSCLAVKKLFEQFTKKPVTVEISSKFLDEEPVVDSKDVIFFISQSGETADSLTALAYCNQRNATTVGITNNTGSSIDRLTTCSLNIQAGVEKGVASTKCYTSQFMCLVLIALYISQDDNSCEKRRKEIIKEIQTIPEKLDQCLKIDYEKAVDMFFDKSSILIIARGYQGATCFEGALKLKELTYIHCEGILAGELKHGPLALVTSDMPIITVVANDEFYDKSHNALEQIEARGGSPVVICTEDIKDKYKHSLAVPKTIDCLQGILTVIPFQVLSYKIAVKKGFDPDFPRNLAKSVTVE